MGVNENLKYVKELKCVNALPSKKQNQCFVDKYGLRYEIAMDLNYKEMVTNNEMFSYEMVSELASILKVHPSLTHLENTREGSVIVSVAVCAIGFVFMLFGCLTMQKLSLFF